MKMREHELNLISKFTTYTFFTLYGIGLASRVYRKGTYRYARDWMKHLFLFAGGGIGAGLFAEKLACELHYNKVLYLLADKYNFTPQEVTELQRNLNEYYIEREKNEDLARAN
uniref:Uncharacterized protein n=1 Tax=Euplotes harpa TaxID=151035 RepID=A0A7S3JBU6_9SPIT|mmetsp:Transcript_26726/g.30856  ORF Transcript_26726/g.30856 Transcript_26726/m.30856 type:complete len:113 (+) Transcript_26726:136-474(+)